MEGITHWIQNLAYFLIFSAIIGIILPTVKYKKYIDLCLGLVLILILISPVKDWVNKKEIPVNEFFTGLAGKSTSPDLTEYENLQQRMIQQSFNTQAESQLKEMLSKQGYELASAEVEPTEDYSALSAVRVTVRKAKRKRGFIYLDPSPEDAERDMEKIKNIISGFYNMSTDNIYIEIE